ncbi:MAG: hypothetical protein ACM3ML_24820 [Micromonosporaceae bacterium]
MIHRGRIGGEIDFGDITSGDPATDLSVAWMLLPTECHHAFTTPSAPCSQRLKTGAAIAAASRRLATSSRGAQAAAKRPAAPRLTAAGRTLTQPVRRSPCAPRSTTRRSPRSATRTANTARWRRSRPTLSGRSVTGHVPRYAFWTSGSSRRLAESLVRATRPVSST